MLKYLFALGLLAASASLQANQQIWQDIEGAQRQVTESTVRALLADNQALKSLLDAAPPESSGDKSHILYLPMPDGSFSRFAVVESPIMEAALAAKYPQIKNYKVYGIDDPAASGRLSFNSNGFDAMLHTSKGRVFIDPDGAQTGRYLLKTRPGARGGDPFQCAAYHLDDNNRPRLQSSAMRSANRVAGQYLTYRLAVAATLEYYNHPLTGNGNLGQTTTAINTAINRVNEIYERDLGIRLLLIGNNDLLYETVDAGLLTNNNGLTLIGEVQGWIDGRIANIDYDIGHIFSTGAGGVAFIGAVCDNPNKAKGVTGNNPPSGDPFYIDFVAHEIGHQFNADHSFNGTTNSCGGGNRNASTAFEPGSGTTIMGYAGICGVEDLQGNSDATFHAGSIAQINGFVGGVACNAVLANGNSDPTITAIPDRTIPANTAFVLDNLTATDIDGGTMFTYQWDQMNFGSETDPVSFGTDLGDNPLFRSYAPRMVPYRNFPALGTQVNAAFDDAEVIPCQSRTLDFRLTVRDQDSGQVTDSVRVAVNAASGPFAITSHATSQSIDPTAGAITVTWNPANTHNAPVSCANVDIELLTFSAGHASYSVQALGGGAAVPNVNGTADVTLPDISNALSRLRVKCSNNVFYDISNANLNITGTTPIAAYGTTVFFNTAGTVDSTPPICPVLAAPSSGGGGGGDTGAIDLLWLFLLGGLSLGSRLLRRQG